MLRSRKSIWTLVLALALLASAPGPVRTVWADPNGSIGGDAGGAGGPGESGDPDLPQGGTGKTGGKSSGAATPGGTVLGQRFDPTLYTLELLKAQMLMRWFQLAFHARGL